MKWNASEKADWIINMSLESLQTPRIPIGTTHGVETEHILADPNGDPLPMQDTDFARVMELAGKGKYHLDELNGRQNILGVNVPGLGEIGLDAARSLAENAIEPTKPGETMPLEVLAQRALRGIVLANRALMEMRDTEMPASISMSNNPLGNRDKETYEKLVTPKGIYEILWRRGWDHTAGIHCAHTSPWTSVNLEDATEALNATVALGGLMISIFGNSPFEEGKATGFKENRQRMWPRLLGSSCFPTDMLLVGMPREKPQSLSHYFKLMCETPVMLVIAGNDGDHTSDYKGSGVYTVVGNPLMIDYLGQSDWTGLELGNSDLPKIEIHPTAHDFQTQQFMQFWGARIRFALHEPQNIPAKDLQQAILENRLEQFLAPYLTMLCIEARDFGTALPHVEDPETNPLIVPNAMQMGLIRNLREASTFVCEYPWDFWKAVREEGVRNGLAGNVDGISLLDLSRRYVQIVERGLTSEEARYMRPAVAIVESGQSRADNLLTEYDRLRSKPDDPNAMRILMNRRRFPKELVQSLT
jgi:hypothetical protein